MKLLTAENAEVIAPFRSLGNDLFADFFCDAEHCRGALVRVPSGYNDVYFFRAVNRGNRGPITCPGCGQEWIYRWTPAGVLCSKIDVASEGLS
jgi:hypothetical protein